MDPSRILIVYYSRTGTTRAVASALRAELSCDVEPIVDRSPRGGTLGFLRSIVDSVFGLEADLDPLNVNLRDYDLVLIGTPVWNTTMSTPVRTFLSRHRDELRRVGFFCTYGGTGSARALREMAALCGQAPVLTLGLRMAEVKDHPIARKVRTFASALQLRLRRAAEPDASRVTPALTHLTAELT